MVDKIWQTVYLGLGSNLNQPKKQLEKAMDTLNALSGCRWLSASSFIESLPQGPQDQPNFINAVVAIETCLSPMDLLRACQAIELRLGKQKKRDWGERVIDIDLLLYGQQIIDEADLIVPHPNMLTRDFVLLPLLEISPELILPNGQPVAHYVSQLSETFVIRT